MTVNPTSLLATPNTVTTTLPEMAPVGAVTVILVALQPENVGLPRGNKPRRVHGLRRAEVAELAGLSASWYTFFEMGRQRAMSPRMVDQVAGALRLGYVEQGYLRALVLGPDVRQRPADPAVTGALA